MYTRVSLEGIDKNKAEVLVKGLYEKPSMLKKKKKNTSNVFLDILQYNNFRIRKWMAQAYYAGTFRYSSQAIFRIHFMEITLLKLCELLVIQISIVTKLKLLIEHFRFVKVL